MEGRPPQPSDDGASPRWPDRLGDFEIGGILGRGGMGLVYDARTPSGERVALKTIQAPTLPGEGVNRVPRFLREARILQTLRHPGIVRLIDAGEVEGTLYLAMERIEGVSLLAVRRAGPIGFDAVTEVGARLASALGHMHDAGIVHRDIKPANILVKPDGQPIITDFGISSMDKATGITRKGDLLGSPGFMAPEVVYGERPTPRSDQYSLGRLMYEMSARGPSKRLPRRAPLLDILRAAMEVDWDRFPSGGSWPELAQTLQRMLHHDPEERFDDAAAIEQALARGTREVLASDTLGEHVERLALPHTSGFEDLAHDLVAPPPAAATDAEGSAPTRPVQVATVDAAPTKLWGIGELSRPPSAGGEDALLLPPDPEAAAETQQEGFIPLAIGASEAGTEATRPSPGLPPVEHDRTVEMSVPDARPSPTKGRDEDKAGATPVGTEPRDHRALRQALARARAETNTLREALDTRKGSRSAPWLLACLISGLLGLLLGAALPSQNPIRTRVLTWLERTAPEPGPRPLGPRARPNAEPR